MAEGVVVITESSSDGDSSGGSAEARRRRSLGRRKRRRRRLRDGPQEPAEIIDLTGDDIVVRTAVSNNLDIFDLTETKETLVSPLHTSVTLKHSTPVSMQPVCSSKILCTTDSENKANVPISLWERDCKQLSPTEGTMKQNYFQIGLSLISNYSGDSEGSSCTTYNSDLGSLGSPQVPSDAFSFSSTNDNSEHPTLLDCMEEGPSSCPPEGDSNSHLSPPHKKWFPSAITHCSPLSVPTSPAEVDRPLLEAYNSTSSAASPDVQELPEQIDLTVWVKTLQYFQQVPIHHPFLQNVVQEKRAGQNKQLKPQPIPSQRLSMVSSTIEENFFQGTLDFLMDYVSCQFYPPKEITFCVVKRILLSSERQEVQQEILKDAYMLLLKIQALHPATADTVVWDWELLREVMEEKAEPVDIVFELRCRGPSSRRQRKWSHSQDALSLSPDSQGNAKKEKFPGRLLFLQYVIQTLEDDFQRTARTGILHKSIAKAMLSCDKCSSNVKEVIEWLVNAVTGVWFSQHRRLPQKSLSPLLEPSGAKSGTLAPELHLDQTMQTDETWIQLQSQKEVALLQRMLSIAVEVDKSPNCSAYKIADTVFSIVLNIPNRCQRETFLNSMECHLLRCKVLELIFHHSCEMPTNLPLSMAKILYFLNHFSLLLKYQDSEATWLRWDEMLQYLNLLLLSYRSIVQGHLRISVCERIKLIIKAAKPQLQSHDNIPSSEIESSINSFQEQLSQTLGQPLPSSIKEKTELLNVLLLTSMEM